MDKSNTTAIQESFQRFIAGVERIAAALEAIAGKPAIAPVLTRAAAADAPLPVAQPDATAPAPGSISYDAIRDAVMKYGDRYGEEAGKALLKRFHATYIKKIDPKDYAAVLEACKAGS
jgi:hypothetical protein